MTPDTGLQLVRGDRTADAIDRLALIERLAIVSENARLAADARQLIERVAGGRFFVACVGQFKRGKSTLLNGLVGVPILPAGVVPGDDRRHQCFVTARHRRPVFASRTAATRRFDRRRSPTTLPRSEIPATNGAWPRSKWTCRATCLHPACAWLTPRGLDSVLAANTEVTRAFIPHIDAALVVLGADPPISSEELNIVGEVGQQVEPSRVRCQQGRSPPGRRNAGGDVVCPSVVVKRLGRPVGEFFQVSAAERAAGMVSRDWARLESALRDLTRQSSEVIALLRRRGPIASAANFCRPCVSDATHWSRRSNSPSAGSRSSGARPRAPPARRCGICRRGSVWSRPTCPRPSGGSRERCSPACSPPLANGSLPHCPRSATRNEGRRGHGRWRSRSTSRARYTDVGERGGTESRGDVPESDGAVRPARQRLRRIELGASAAGFVAWMKCRRNSAFARAPSSSSRA